MANNISYMHFYFCQTDFIKLIKYEHKMKQLTEKDSNNDDE